jgi:hypothetical protein
MGVRNERGLGLLLALFATMLVSAITAALVLTTSSEALTAGAFGAAQQALYAAESVAEWAIADLTASGADWAAITGGTSPSAFVDGPAGGSRELAGGTTLNLDAIAAANAGWRLYAYGRLDDLLPGTNRLVGFYVLLFVAPDGAAANRMKIRALSFGPRGAASTLETIAVRIGTGVATEAWRR